MIVKVKHCNAHFTAPGRAGSYYRYPIYFCRHHVKLIRRDRENIRLDLAMGIALALDFKMAGEVLRTVVVREWGELLILGSIIIPRAALTFLIHREIKMKKRNCGTHPEAGNAFLPESRFCRKVVSAGNAILPETRFCRKRDSA